MQERNRLPLTMREQEKRVLSSPGQMTYQLNTVKRVSGKDRARKKGSQPLLKLNCCLVLGCYSYYFKAVIEDQRKNIKLNRH
jgi:hypothetical protein